MNRDRRSKAIAAACSLASVLTMAACDADKSATDKSAARSPQDSVMALRRSTYTTVAIAADTSALTQKERQMLPLNRLKTRGIPVDIIFEQGR
ncbi:MAG: hypothetical protein H7Z40_20695 [Phycisphaerae bacterium]|nr:hypothetical protein [Gemmatimonadaceae bacterium]